MLYFLVTVLSFTRSVAIGMSVSLWRSALFSLGTTGIALTGPLLAYSQSDLDNSLFTAPEAVHAQETANPYGNRDEAQSTEYYHPPAIFVTDPVVASTDTAGVVRGVFTIQNGDQTTVGDISYRFDLLGRLEPSGSEVVADMAPLYDRAFASETYTLIPGESRAIEFMYDAPQLPSGVYRLRVQLLTSQGKELGWGDMEVQLSGSDVPHVSLVPGTIHIAEYGDRLLPPLSGPNVDPNGTLTLRATATSASRQSVQPVVEIFSFDDAGELLETIELDPVAVSGETTLDVPITASSTPGAYYGRLTLRSATDNTLRLSPIADFRWVVRGTSAKIIALRMVQFAEQAGDDVVVDVEFVGPADAESRVTANVTVELIDEQGVTAQRMSPEPRELSDSIDGAQVRLPLERSLGQEPRLRATLTDTSGTVLDSYEVPLQLTAEQRATLVTQAQADDEEVTTAVPFSFSWRALGLLVGSAAIVVVVISGAVMIIRRRRMPMQPLLWFIAFMLLGTAASVQANNGIIVNQASRLIEQRGAPADWRWKDLNSQRVIEIFVNQPLHDAPAGTYPRSNIPYSVRVNWAVCKNALAFSQIATHYLSSGQKYSGLFPPGGSQWIPLGDQVNWGVDCNRNPAQCIQCASYFCTAARNYTAPTGLNLSQLPADATAATIQVVSRWGWHLQQIPWQPNNPRQLYDREDIHATNLWLNFTPPPTPLPPTPPPDDDDQPLSCTPQAKFEYLAVANVGNGNMQPQTFVGTDQVVASGQWFDLQPPDGSLADKNSPGLLVQRLAQGFRVVFPGNHQTISSPPNHAEATAVRITLKDAVLTGYEPSEDHPIERHGDGLADDPIADIRKAGLYNAELFHNPGSSVAVFNARVTSNEDNFTIFYEYPEDACRVTDLSVCTASQATVQTNESVTFTSGVGPLTWNVSGGSPANGTGESITTSFATSGAKTVTPQPLYYLDVNGDNVISTADATVIANPGSLVPRTGAPWQHPDRPRDVNRDGTVNGQDALALNTFLAARGAVRLTDSSCQVTVTDTITPPYEELDGPTADFTVPAQVTLGDVIPARSTSTAGNAPMLHNEDNSLDVTDDGSFNQADVTALQTFLAERPVTPIPGRQGPFIDVNGDGRASTQDVLTHLAAYNSGNRHQTGGQTPWQNPVNRYDVTGEGIVNTKDTAAIIAWLQRPGAAGALLTPPPYYDVDGNSVVNQADLTILTTALANGETTRPAVTNLTLQWQVTRLSDGANVTPSNARTPAIDVSATHLSVYRFTLTVSDARGLSDSATKTVVVVDDDTTVDPPPVPITSLCTPLQQTYTVGQAQPASFESTLPGISLTWSAPGGTPSSGEGASFTTTYSEPGTKTVRVEPLVPPYVDVNGDNRASHLDLVALLDTEDVTVQSGAAWQNHSNPRDVNGDGQFSSADGQELTANLTLYGSRTLPTLECQVTVQGGSTPLPPTPTPTFDPGVIRETE